MTIGKPFVFMAAALASNGGIGYKKGLPWSIPGDWQYFEDVTTKSYGDSESRSDEWSNVVILGRHSYEARPMLGEPLANRYNIVVSRNLEYDVGNSPIAELVNSLDEAFDKADIMVKEDGRVFMLGGEELYRQSISLPQCTHILITNIYSSTPIPCDTFIPEIDPSVYQLVSHKELESFLKRKVPKGRQQYENFEYEFVLYVRK
ncbi:dihydrofolate reductase-like domain-containing protein [Thamnidium elegans]|nr:dihydrofolate reductase-like domain-containing protein [Thamnidium elegans]